MTPHLHTFRLILILVALQFAATIWADEPPPSIESVNEAVQKFVDARELSGAVTLIADRDGILHLGAVGKADLDSGRSMTPDTLFWIASMTKPIAGTAVMILQDEGKLSVDDPVSKHLPEYEKLVIGPDRTPAQNVMTIKHLVTHTSGLAAPPWPEGGDTRSLEVQAYDLAAQPLNFEPGTRWQYGYGLSVAGRVVEVVSGMPFDKFVRERITDPLGMRDTTFHLNDAQYGRFATLYKLNDDKSALVPAIHKFVTPDPVNGANIVPSPSGGMFSTALDLARYYQMVLRGGEGDGTRIVSADAVEQMTTIQTGDLETGFTPGNGWGLGWCVVREPQGVSRLLSPGTFGHGGAYGTQAWIDPERGLIFVLLIQRPDLGNSDASAIREAFQEAALNAAAH
jgi:CubicO group peptidase (beta-lactamase class C family)